MVEVGPRRGVGPSGDQLGAVGGDVRGYVPDYYCTPASPDGDFDDIDPRTSRSTAVIDEPHRRRAAPDGGRGILVARTMLAS